MNIYYMPFNCIPSPRIKSTGLDFSDLEKSFDENFEKLNESFRLISKKTAKHKRQMEELREHILT